MPSSGGLGGGGRPGVVFWVRRGRCLGAAGGGACAPIKAAAGWSPRSRSGFARCSPLPVPSGSPPPPPPPPSPAPPLGSAVQPDQHHVAVALGGDASADGECLQGETPAARALGPDPAAPGHRGLPGAATGTRRRPVTGVRGRPLASPRRPRAPGTEWRGARGPGLRQPGAAGFRELRCQAPCPAGAVAPRAVRRPLGTFPQRAFPPHNSDPGPAPRPRRGSQGRAGGPMPVVLCNRGTRCAPASAGRVEPVRTRFLLGKSPAPPARCAPSAPASWAQTRGEGCGGPGTAVWLLSQERCPGRRGPDKAALLFPN